MTKISVIVPVYNTEKYLSQCLESLINQTLKDIEIICVNDASKDSSLDVIKEYSKKDSRIKFINFENNKGVSAARNAGLDIATGEFVFFIDSDDWISENYLEDIRNVMDEADSDLVFNRNVISYQDGKFYPYNFQQGQLDIPDNSYVDPPSQAHNVFCGPCSKLYKHKFIKENNLKFPEGYVYEDIFFHYAVFAYAKNVYFYNGEKYFYRKTENSITTTIKQDSDKIIKIFGLIYDFYKGRNLLDKNIKIFYTLPFFNVQNEDTYTAFKSYFSKAGEYILNNEIFNDMDKFFCKIILDSENYKDYLSKYSPNVAISYIRRKK